MRGTKMILELPVSKLRIECHTYTYNIAGKDTVCVLLNGLAKLSDKRPHTLREWERFGWLPPANLRAPADMENRPGNRLYTTKYAVQMAELIRQTQSGTKIPVELTSKLYALLKEEAAEITT